MKKISALLLLILTFTVLLPAQDHLLYINGVYIFGDENFSRTDGSKAENKISEMTTRYFEKGKQTIAFRHVYDTSGRETGLDFLDKNNKLTGSYKSEFDEKGHEIIVTNTSKKSAAKKVKEYGPYKLPLKIVTYKGKNLETLKITRTVINTFNEDGNLSSSQTLDGKNELIGKVNYTYDASKKLGEAKMYNKKGKLKYTWNFTCEPEGKVERKSESKKEVKVCKSREEMSNGHYREITISNYDDGIVKHINEYDSTGNGVGSEHYVGKDGSILSTKVQSIHLGGDTLFYYHEIYAAVKDNYIIERTEHIYLKNKNLSSHTQLYKSKNKLSSDKTSAYTFTSDGLVAKESVTDHVKHVTSEVNYSYTKY